MGQLSTHFSLAELTTTDTALDNTPPPDEERILAALAQFLEKVRHVLGDKPMTINSAFRSEAVNAWVGGVPNSAHRLCFAADFTCAEFGTPYEVCLALQEAD